MSDAGLRAEVRAVRGSLALDVDLAVGRETLVVAGPNGAGKTTLLEAILGLAPLTGGRVAIAGEVVRDVDARIDVAVERRRIGYVPQDLALFPHMTVAENVAFAVACAAPRRARRARIDAARAQLAALGLTALADRSPGTLSGGEQQRVGLARALAARPRALLLDEPLAALDVRARRDVRDVLVETLASAAVPTIVVTHDAEDARRLGHRVVVLEAGRVTQEGTWDAIAASPATPFARRLATST